MGFKIDLNFKLYGHNGNAVHNKVCYVMNICMLVFRKNTNLKIDLVLLNFLAGINIKGKFACVKGNSYDIYAVYRDSENKMASRIVSFLKIVAI